MKKTWFPLLLTLLAAAPTLANPSRAEKFLFKKVVDPAIDLTSRQNLKHITPVGLTQAKGLVREIYGQVQDTFAPPAEPFLLLSPSPEALLGFWLISYESFVPKYVPRVAKETIAVSVATRNEAPYCEQSHRAVGLSTRPSEAIQNAFRKGSFREGAILPEAIRPYHLFASSSAPNHRVAGISEEQLPEVVGVALTFHFITRLINVFTREPVFQVTGHPHLKDRMFETMAKWRVGSLARANQESFTAIRLAEKYGYRMWNDSVPPLLGGGRISYAFAVWSDIMETVRARLVKEGVSEAELNAVEAGVEQGVAPTEMTPAVRFALGVALNDHSLLDQEVAAARRQLISDRALVDLASWSAYLATQKVAEGFR